MSSITDRETAIAAHAERYIRRELDKQGHTFYDGERDTLKAAAIKAGTKDSSAYAVGAKRAEAIINQYKNGLINASGKMVVAGDAASASAETPIEADGTPIDLDGLPARTINALSTAGIKTIEELQAWKDANGDFTQLDGVGVASAAKLQALLPVVDADVSEVESEDESEEATDSKDTPE